MGSGINVLCFAASYSVALAMEVAGLWARTRWQQVGLLVATLAGLVAHTWYLGQRAAEMPTAPLATAQDWFLVAAWTVAVVYLAANFYSQTSAGLFLLPGVLGLIAASRFADTSPLTTFEATRGWARIHGILLMLGTVAVLLGFVAGLMYLIQSYRLKNRKLTGPSALKLPSLEWLELANSRSLGAATLLVAGGFFTGVLSRLAHQGEQNFIPWTDPTVVSLAAMLLWLVVAEVFRLVYPAARRGRKVAYLTVAAFGFLLLVLGAVTFRDNLHTAATSPPTHEGGREAT